jgi:hypothetical protein
MPFSVFLDILREHQRVPGQGLGPFTWRHGPPGVATIYDYHAPRRNGILPNHRVGYEEADLNIHSQILNCPSTGMRINGVPDVAPGYRKVLVSLLSRGCVIPSACLDQWLGDDSRKFCDPQLRLFYRMDL